MPRAKRPDRERRYSSLRLPQSLLAFLCDEISWDEACDAEPEPSSIVAPFGIDGSWDGFDNYLLNGHGFQSLFAVNPGLREELDGLFASMGRQPPWSER